MSGSLEPTDHTCHGIHGFVRVEVKDDKNNIALIPFAKREYKILDMEVNTDDTMGSISRRIGEKVTETGDDNIYDIVVSGKRHVTLELMEEKIKSLGNIRSIEDKTEKYFDYEQLKKVYEGCLLQRYISSFQDCEDARELKALEYGTEAILEALKA